MQAPDIMTLPVKVGGILIGLRAQIIYRWVEFIKMKDCSGTRKTLEEAEHHYDANHVLVM